MIIREYLPSDCTQIAQLFYDTVHSVNAADYTREQLDAWADGHVDLEAWDNSFREHFTLVACDGKEIVGFADMDENGYLDRLYVHRDYQRKGVASSLLRKLSQKVKTDEITTYASITARPFFEKMGYRVVRQNIVERKGVSLINYFMVKKLS
jgi:putative acetyltransferase